MHANTHTHTQFLLFSTVIIHTYTQEFFVVIVETVPHYSDQVGPEILLPVCQVPELNVYNHSGSEKRFLRRWKHSKCLYSALIRRDKGGFPIKFSAIFKFFIPHNSYLQPFLVVFAFQPFPFLVVLVISLPFPIYQKQCKTIWCKTSMYLHYIQTFYIQNIKLMNIIFPLLRLESVMSTSIQFSKQRFWERWEVTYAVCAGLELQGYIRLPARDANFAIFIQVAYAKIIFWNFRESVLFDTGSQVVLASLELWHSCLYLTNTGITSVCHNDYF